MKRRNDAFTLLELMVVIGIIAVLVGILIPVISRVRENARVADTKNFISQLQGAIETYHQEHRAYPGPLANNEIRNNVNNGTFPQSGRAINPAASIVILPGSSVPAGTYDTNDNAPTAFAARITMSENLVLGLLGGLRINIVAGTPSLVYDPSLVGKGPMSLNAANPKVFTSSLNIADNQLSWRQRDGAKSGKFMDGTNFEIEDTVIPEFVDSFPDPMPILYLRAKPGVQIIPRSNVPYNADVNSVITNDPDFTPGRVGSYDLTQIIAYTASYDGMSATPTMEAQPADPNVAPTGSRTIGSGKNPPKKYFINGAEVPYAFPNHGLRAVDVDHTLTPGSGYYLPYDAFPYFQNPGSPNTARNKDSYILIGAGADRMYGTPDDVVSFGTVGG